MEDVHVVVVGLHWRLGLCILLKLMDDLRSGKMREGSNGGLGRAR